MLSREEVERRLEDGPCIIAGEEYDLPDAEREALETVLQLAEWAEDAARSAAWDCDSNAHCQGCHRAPINGPLCKLDMNRGWPCERSMDDAREWLDGRT